MERTIMVKGETYTIFMLSPRGDANAMKKPLVSYVVFRREVLHTLIHHPLFDILLPKFGFFVAAGPLKEQILY